jgi:hypothetical protein
MSGTSDTEGRLEAGFFTDVKVVDVLVVIVTYC